MVDERTALSDYARIMPLKILSLHRLVTPFYRKWHIGAHVLWGDCREIAIGP